MASVALEALDKMAFMSSLADGAKHAAFLREGVPLCPLDKFSLTLLGLERHSFGFGIRFGDLTERLIFLFHSVLPVSFERWGVTM